MTGLCLLGLGAGALLSAASPLLSRPYTTTCTSTTCTSTTSSLENEEVTSSKPRTFQTALFLGLALGSGLGTGLGSVVSYFTLGRVMALTSLVVGIPGFRPYA